MSTRQGKKINKLIERIKNEINEKIMKKYTIENNLLYKKSGKNKLIVTNLNKSS